MAESCGVHCVVKQSMDSAKRRKRSFSPWPAKVFQYFRRFVLNIELMFEKFWDYSLGASNNAWGSLLYPRASTNVEGFLGRGGARRTSREEGGPQNVKNESGEENGIVELGRPRAGSRTLMGLTALGGFQYWLSNLTRG